MPNCKDCEKVLASPQSLSNHRKRYHSGNGAQTVSSKIPPKLRSRTQDEKDAEKILDMLSKPKTSRNGHNSEWIPNGKISKVSTDENLSTDDESDSGAMDAENSDDDGPIVLADKTDSELIDLFHKLYSHFEDEDDNELCEDIFALLAELRERKCVTEKEYGLIKSRLEKMKQLNLYESIDSTVENMTRDDKNEILGLLRSMKNTSSTNSSQLTHNDERVEKMTGLVKDYFKKKTDLESVLAGPLEALKDRLDAIKIKIILNQIEKTRNRVRKIFTQLKADGSDRGDQLRWLRAGDHITDEQYAKLLIGPNTLPSISRIIQGKGMYLSRK